MQAEIDEWKKRFHINVNKKKDGVYRVTQGKGKGKPANPYSFDVEAKDGIHALKLMAVDIRTRPYDNKTIGRFGRNCCMELLKVFELWVPDYRYVTTPEKKNGRDS